MDVTIESIRDNIQFWTDYNGCDNINENIIAFIGPTKAGKSTLINCLMGKRLLSINNFASGEMRLSKAEQCDGGPNIGEDAESESLKPECYGTFYGTDLLLWDFPGFGDNKGVKQEVANAISVKTVLCQQNSVRFILVVPFETIKSSNPFGFYQVLNSILLISPNIANHLILVASKMENGNLKAVLNRLINVPFNNASSERLAVIEKAKDVIKVLLENDALIEFKTPPECLGDGNLYTFPNADDFKKCLNELQGINVSNCNLVLSSQAQLELIHIYECVYSILRVLINDEIVVDIKDKATELVEVLTIQSETPDNLITYGRSKIQEYRRIIENVPSLEDLLMNVGTPEQRSRATMICKNFESLESLRNECGHRLEGQREFRMTVINEINAAMLLVNDAVGNINPNVRLLTQAEVREMGEVRTRWQQVVRENLARVPTIIIDLYRNNRRAINALLETIIAFAFQRFTGRISFR